MRPRSTLVACVLLVALASGPAAQRRAAGLPAEPGPDILRLSPAELWPLLEACADGPPAARSSDEEAEAVFVDEGAGFDSSSEGMQEWMRRYRCGSIARELAHRGGDGDREALWVVFDDPATDDEVRSGVVRGMLEARLAGASLDAGPTGPPPPSGSDPRSPDPLRAPIPARHARLAGHLETPREPEWSGDAAAELRAAYRRAPTAPGSSRSWSSTCAGARARRRRSCASAATSGAPGAGAEPEAESAPGVAFRVRVDGTPWRGPLQASVRRGPRTTTRTLETDATGQLSLDRDLFVDPRRPVESVRLELSRFGGASDTWFGADVGLPADLAAVAELSVDTQHVVLVLPAAHAGPCAASPCTVRLEAETRLEREGDADWSPADGAPEGYRFSRRVTADRLLRADGSWSVRSGRASRYRAVLSAGAAGSWTSPVVELGAAPVTLTLRGDRLRSPAELSEDGAADLAPEE